MLEPGKSAYVKLSDSSISFAPIGTFYQIGATTMNKITDATLFSASLKDENYDYNLSIIPQERIISPELPAESESTLRRHIPIDLNNSYAYTDDDGTSIYLKIKNSGDITNVLNEPDIYNENGEKIDSALVEAPMGGDYLINAGEERILEINVSAGVFDINDEVGVSITSSYNGDVVSSDIGYFHTINRTADLEILEQVDDIDTSMVYNDTQGNILVKNVGNSELTINNLLVNSSAPLSSNLNGGITLNIQETATISFQVNQTLQVGDILTLKVETAEGIFDKIEVIVKAKDS